MGIAADCSFRLLQGQQACRRVKDTPCRCGHATAAHADRTRVLRHSKLTCCCLQTPDARKGRAPSWLADLDAYLASHASSPATALDHRQALMCAVKADPLSPEAWLAFLSNEEAAYGNVTASLPGVAPGEPGSGGGISLYHMFYWATQLVPRSKNQFKDAYIQLWLGYAKQQWCAPWLPVRMRRVCGFMHARPPRRLCCRPHCLQTAQPCTWTHRSRSPDDARDTFKTLKNQHIGDGCAFLYSEWASLEYASGNVSKALGILAKGLREKAQPSRCACVCAFEGLVGAGLLAGGGAGGAQAVWAGKHMASDACSGARHTALVGCIAQAPHMLSNYSPAV